MRRSTRWAIGMPLAIALAVVTLPATGTALALLDVSGAPVTMHASPGQSVQVRIVIHNGGVSPVFISGITTTLDPALGLDQAFDAFLANAPDSLAQDEAWEGSALEFVVPANAVPGVREYSVSLTGGTSTDDGAWIGDVNLRMEISDPTCAPVVLDGPDGITRNAGGSAGLDATASPAGTFQWRRDGVPLADDARIAGATTASLAITPLVPADDGWYDAVITNPCGVATTLPAQLIVLSPVGVGPGGGIDAPRLALVAPNPIAMGASLRWSLPAAGRASLTLHDVSGRLVAVIASGTFEAGEHVSQLPGALARGPARPGVYFVRLFSDAGTISRKAVLIAP